MFSQLVINNTKIIPGAVGERFLIKIFKVISYAIIIVFNFFICINFVLIFY